MNKLTIAAKEYLAQGLAVVVTDENKRAIFPWKKFQSVLPTEAEIENQLSHERACGLAMICGAVSGNIEVIDCDLKYDISGDLWTRLMQSIIDHDLFNLLYIVETRSKGYHIYYKCECIEGNQKLAQRYTTDDERRVNPNEKVLVLLETRGEGGYVIAPPTEGYTVFKKNKINVLSIDQREQLLSICRSFNEVFEEAHAPYSTSTAKERYSTTPWEDYNERGDIIELLKKHGWKILGQRGERIILRRPGKDEGSSGDYHTGLNLFKVFTTSTLFEAGKGYKPAAVYALLECNNDFRQAARQLSDAGYGQRLGDYGHKIEQDIYKRKRDGQTPEEITGAISKNYNLSPEQAKEAVEDLGRYWGPDIAEFWDVDLKGKITINRRKLEQFLSKKGGFYLYFYDKSSTIYRLVQVKDMFVEEASPEQIKKFIKSYIETLPEKFDNGKTPEDLLEVVYKGSEALFNKSYLEFIDRINLDFLKDTKTTAYFPFRNGIVIITADGIYRKTYDEIGKHIWKTQVIDFNIDIMPDMDSLLCEYFRFIQCICNQDSARWEYAMSLMGYLLHKYKDPSRPYATILAEETEHEAKGGGTGKGIFIKALTYLLNTVRVDGKNFKLDKSFAFQRIGLDTRLLSIEDVRRNVDFEGFYSMITEGMTVEKKNKDELFIPYEDSPKIIFSTNYSISQSGNHARRRQKVFEFGNFFTPERTPEDHFGHKLFDDWDNDEWNRFYNFFFTCVHLYLDMGILVHDNGLKLKRKHIKLHYTEEFLEYYDEMEPNAWLQFNDLYTSFLKINDFDKKDYSQKRFKKAMSETTELYGLALEERKNRQNNNLKELKKVVTDFDKVRLHAFLKSDQIGSEPVAINGKSVVGDLFVTNNA